MTFSNGTVLEMLWLGDVWGCAEQTDFHQTAACSLAEQNIVNTLKNLTSNVTLIH